MKPLSMRSLLFRLSVIVTCFAMLGAYGFVGAQDTPTDVPVDAPVDAPTEAPTDVPTEVPTDVPTEAPTDVPTEEPTEVPTEAPTDVPTEEPTDVPTDVPTEEPTEVPTEAPTLSPDAVPPVINLDVATVYEVAAGQGLAFQFSVSDEAGVVRVLADSPAVTINAIDPVESAAPFNTVVQLVYTAPLDASGASSFTLTALDADGLSSVVVVQVNVIAAAPTEEPISETPLPVATEERILNYNPNASEESIQAMLTALNAVEISRLPQIGALHVMIPVEVGETASALGALQGSAAGMAAGLSSVEPITWYDAHFEPNDPFYKNNNAPQPEPAGPLYSRQWSFKGGAAGGGIYVNGAWDISTKDGAGVTVAVLDTGVDLQHPEFAGQLVAGWDFVNDDNNPDDDQYHGTHVAGVIAARTNNGVGIAGIAFKSKIMPVKVLNSAGVGSNYWIAAGIIHATDKGAKVINMSLGGSGYSNVMAGAVAYALSRNVVVIASAGNNNTADYNYPASYPGVISVAATDIQGNRADYSTFNDRVTIAAPGGDSQSLGMIVDEGIWSTIPLQFVTPGLGNYGYLSGTSMAAPHVSGVAALVISQGAATTPANVREALICSAVDKGTPGYDNEYGYGLIQADWALNWGVNSPNCKVGTANDLFQTAQAITKFPFTSTSLIHPRNVTEDITDPQICGAARQQTLWYSIKPAASGIYNINTLGSSHDTIIGIYGGQQGALTQIACNDDYAGVNFSRASLMRVPLVGGQTYYIATSTFGGDVTDQLRTINVAPGMLNYADYQENNAAIAYAGTWAKGTGVMSTSDVNALAIFSFRGTYFEYFRTVGPDKGTAEIWIDGVLAYTLSNQAAVTKTNQARAIAYQILTEDNGKKKDLPCCLRRACLPILQS